jgi:hypothetical protein
LTSTFDATTRTNETVFDSVDNNAGDHRSFFINSSGTKYFNASFSADFVNEYDLSSAFDVDSRGSIVDSFGKTGAIGLDFV